MPVSRQENTTIIAKEVQPTGTNAAYVHRRSLTAPAAANTSAIHAAISTAIAVITAITNPVFPRNVTVTGAGVTHTASGNVIITGTDIRDQVITETLALNGNTTVAGNKAFKTITKIDATGVSGIDASSTVLVGTGNKFGLTRKMDSDGVIKATVDGASETLPTVAFSATSISDNTVTPNTAANAAHNYVFSYVTNEVYAPN